MTQDFHLKPGYIERVEPHYFEDEEDSEWQPDVYPFALGLLSACGASKVIDIGCGKAAKLKPFFDANVAVMGIDYGANIAYCRERYPRGHWREADLERIDEALCKDLQFIDPRGAVLIVADVIEHLRNPWPLLQALRDWMTAARIALISTPERDLEYGAQHSGPPPNEAHVREWNRAELETLLKAAGLNVIHVGLTRAHTSHVTLRTTLAVIGQTS